MIYPRIRDTLLTLFGVTAMMVYVLACRPSFSPDGTKVVFSVIDSKANRTSVILYDLNKKTSETIFVTRGAKDDGLAYMAQWLPDGRRVVVNGVSSIMILPLGSLSPIQLIPLNDKLDTNALMIPPPVIGKYQFFASKTDRLRVNLETGEILKVSSKGEETCYLAGLGSQVYYIAETGDEKNAALEIGRLDTEKLTRMPFLELKPENHQEFTQFLASTKDGSRLALTGQSEDAPCIWLYRGNTLEKTIPVTAKESGMRLGNAEWSLNEKTIYASYYRKPGEDNKGRFGVLEVPVDGGSIHETVLFPGKIDDSSAAFFQISLSPDGRHIAASSTCMEADDINPEDRALFLIDVSGPRWKVTKVPVAFSSAAKSDAEKK